MYDDENDVVVSSLTMDGADQVLKPFVDSEDVVDKIRIGEFCFFSHNAQKHVTMHYEQNDASQHQLLEMDSNPAEIDDLITFRSSWTGSTPEDKAYDILVAAVGNTLHATRFDGKTLDFIPLS